MTYLGTLVVLASIAATTVGLSECDLTSCTEGSCPQLQNCLLRKERDGCARWEIGILARDAVTRCLFERGQPCSLAPLTECYADFLYEFTSTAIPESEQGNVAVLAAAISGYLQRLQTNCSVPYASIRSLEECVVPVTQRADRTCPEAFRLLRQRYLGGSRGQPDPWQVLRPAISAILGGITSYTRACRRSAAILVWPSFGPASGGTNVTIVGALTAISGQRAISVNFGNVVDCDVIQSRTTTEFTVCKTRPILQLRGQNLNRPLEVFVTLLTGGQQTSRVSTRNNFTYKPDPVVSRLIGLQTVISGGTIVTVEGTNLGSVRNPEMWITILYVDGTIRSSWSFLSLCNLKSDTRLYCVVPPLVNPKELPITRTTFISTPSSPITRRRRSAVSEIRVLNDLLQNAHRARSPVHLISRRSLPDITRLSREADETPHDVTLSRHARSTRRRLLSRHKRDVCGSPSPEDEQLNDNKDLTFCVDLRLDDAPGVPDSCDFQMDVFVDPEVRQFTDPDRIHLYRPFWPVSDSSIQIRGSRLTSGLDCSHFTVEIGDATCSMEDLTTDALTCAPPSEKPRSGEEDSTRRGFPEVVVLIGDGSLRFSIGFLEYHSNVFDNPAARYGLIGAIVGVLLIITVTALVCCVIRGRRR